MKPISEIISNTPDNNRIEPIIAGTKFKIATSAYSDRTYIDVICLKEINHQVIEQMNLEFEILENKRDIYGLYDYIVPWFYINGYVAYPEFLPVLNFGYETYVTKSDFEINPYYEKNFQEKLSIFIPL